MSILPPKDALFAPEAGCAMLLLPSGCEERLRTSLVGLERGRYLVLSLAPLLRGGADPARLFVRGRRTRLFFRKEGVVQGYVVQVQGFTTSPFKHLYLTYPEEGESYNLRLHERVETHLLGMVRTEGVSAKCMVVDLSEGGCGLVADPEHQDRFLSMAEGEDVLLRFQLNTLDRICEISSRLIGLRSEEGRTMAALRFTYMDERTGRDIAKFIRFVCEHRV
jgi:hypothetical protein